MSWTDSINWDYNATISCRMPLVTRFNQSCQTLETFPVYKTLTSMFLSHLNLRAHQTWAAIENKRNWKHKLKYKGNFYVLFVLLRASALLGLQSTGYFNRFRLKLWSLTYPLWQISPTNPLWNTSVMNVTSDCPVYAWCRMYIEIIINARSLFSFFLFSMLGYFLTRSFNRASFSDVTREIIV